MPENNYNPHIETYSSDSETYSNESDYNLQGINDSDGRSKPRHENSLGVLTNNFVKLIKDSPEFTLDLNEAVRRLNVQKRRIYDITNVLEGIGYIEKLSKNKIKWVGQNEENNYKEEINELSSKMKELETEEKKIDGQIQNVHNMINNLMEDEESIKHAYMTYEDLKTLNSLEIDGPFFIIEAPKDTNIDILQPKFNSPEAVQSQNRDYPHQVYFESKDSEIKVYLVSEKNQEMG